MLTDMGFSVDEAYLDQVMGKFDQDGSGNLDAAEFEAVLAFFKPPGRVETISDEVENVFAASDVDKDGSLSRAEVEKLLQGMGYKVDEAYLDQVMGKFDLDGSGGLEAKEFDGLLAFIKVPTGSKKTALEVANTESAAAARFALLDLNKSNTLEKPEVVAMLQSMGYAVDDAYVDQVMAQFDRDGSGSVERAEFDEVRAAPRPRPPTGANNNSPFLSL